VCVPVNSRGRILGTLSLGRQTDVPFDEPEIALLEATADQVGIALDNARLYSESVRQLEELRLKQAQLVHAEKLSAVGELASGVAHEINNPLTATVANLEFALEQARLLGVKHGSSEVEQLDEMLRDASEGAACVRTIIRDLKIFSRAEEDNRGPIEVERVLESSLRMAWNEIRHRARLVKNYGSTPLVEASEARLGQVFMNLAIKAAQAIAEGNAEDNEISVSTSTDPAGRATIEIADTGPGMPPEVLCRLFTPFFTTKPVGVGTGLGLSICHRIITSCGGSIQVTSEVGKGTTFRISLPASHAEVSEVALDVTLDVAALRRGRILVVDDEPMIGKALQRAMSDEHEVIATTSASQALESISAGESFDVILCDLMMPQMTGMDLHEALVRVAPEQADRMIFLSGGEFTERARAFIDTTSNKRLEKPFDVRRLQALINECIR
jgi:signal transduction histidine kinase/CheY-like chemotaxis protein